MKLYYSTASPYARTAQVVLREVGLDAESIETETHPFNNQPDFLATNPLGKVPCLLLDSNESLYDSEVICQYLDCEFNDERLWLPIKTSWSLRKLYSQVAGLLDLAVALRQEKMRDDEGLRSDFWWQRFESGLTRGLNDLNKSCGRFPDELTLLHINTICLLDYLTFRHPELKFEGENLAAIATACSRRSSFQETLPTG